MQELDEALSGTELIVSGVSSFGVDWFMENVIPRIPDGMPVLSVTKGMMNAGKGELISYPEMYRCANPPHTVHGGGRPLHQL